MKKIIVQWVKTDAPIEQVYGGMAMVVIDSNHPRFINGSRFDYGFMNIATQQDGYTVELRPLSA